MSFAVIQTGGKQYKVMSGEILKVERLEDSKPEAKIEFKEILAYGDDKTIEVGSPVVEGAKVEADLVKNSKNRTILIFKKLRTHLTKALFSAIGPRKCLAKLFVLFGEASPIAEKVTCLPSVS